MKYLRYLKTRQKSWTLSPSRFTAHHMEGWSSCCPWPWQKCTKTQNKTPWISDFLPVCNVEVLKLYTTMCHWNISGPFLMYEYLFIHIIILWYLYWSIETETHDSCVPQIVERLTFLWGRWISKQSLHRSTTWEPLEMKRIWMILLRGPAGSMSSLLQNHCWDWSGLQIYFWILGLVWIDIDHEFDHDRSW